MPPSLDHALARRLAHRSAEEMVDALGLARAPRVVRGLARRAFRSASTPLGGVLAAFDGHIEHAGIAEAAKLTLEHLSADWKRSGTVPTGPLLVVANHPGAYDALVLLAAMERRDVSIVAADRAFLRALPHLLPHLAFVADDARPGGSVAGVKRALSHLKRGGVLLHFGAGRIEPDPAFAGRGPMLLPWLAGTGALVRGVARTHGHVVVAAVRGVHSASAKRSWAARLAERRGVTTIAPLLQVTLSRYRDVAPRVAFSTAYSGRDLAEAHGHDGAIAEHLRSVAAGLLTR
jgi:hypothetical protein